MPAALEFVGITKRYRSFFGREVHALADFSLAVEPGEILGFLGPNGAGKTTAIHLAMGFMRPTSGSGTMLGAPFGHAVTRRRIGFLAENVALHHLPAQRLLRFYGELNGVRDPVLGRRVREVLETVNLLSEASSNVAKFSRGMLQRVGLAQALLNDPDLLILDEPTSALDPVGRVSVRELLLAARAAGKTIFLSSHMLSEIEVVCDRVGILNRGRLVRVGRTSDLLESQRLSEIVARGISATQFPGSTQTEDGIRMVISTARLRSAIEQIWAAGGEVVRVNPMRRSLEEIFLELTGNAAPGDDGRGREAKAP